MDTLNNLVLQSEAELQVALPNPAPQDRDIQSPQTDMSSTETLNEKLESLEKVNAELKHKLRAQQYINATLNREASRLCVVLETEREEKAKEKRSLMGKLVREWTCRNMLEKQLREMDKAHLQDMKVQGEQVKLLRGEVSKLRGEKLSSEERSTSKEEKEQDKGEGFGGRQVRGGEDLWSAGKTSAKQGGQCSGFSPNAKL